MIDTIMSWVNGKVAIFVVGTISIAMLLLFVAYFIAKFRRS